MADFLDAPFPAIRGQAPFPAIRGQAPFPAIRGQAPHLFHVVDIPEDEIVVPRDGRLMHLLGLGDVVERVFEPVLRNPDAYLIPRGGPFEELPHHWDEFPGNDYLGLQEHLQEEWDASEQVEALDNQEEGFPENDDPGVQEHLQEELGAPEEEGTMDNEEEGFPENDGLGVQQHLQEELEAPEQVEDTDSEEEEFPENDDPGVQEHLQEKLEAPDQVEDMDNEEEGFPENDGLGVQQHLQEELEAPEHAEAMDNEEEAMDCTQKASQDVDAMTSASQHVTKRVNLTTNDLLLRSIGSSPSFVSSFGVQQHSAMPDASGAVFGPISEPVTTSEVQELNI